MGVKVHVEYCGGCGYQPRYDELKRCILEASPDAEVEGVSGRKASFEVTVNDKVVFSKLEKGAFPDFQEVVDIVQKANSDEEFGEVQGTQTCTIL